MKYYFQKIQLIINSLKKLLDMLNCKFKIKVTIVFALFITLMQMQPETQQSIQNNFTQITQSNQKNQFLQKSDQTIEQFTPPVNDYHVMQVFNDGITQPSINKNQFQVQPTNEEEQNSNVQINDNINQIEKIEYGQQISNKSQNIEIAPLNNQSQQNNQNTVTEQQNPQNMKQGETKQVIQKQGNQEILNNTTQNEQNIKILQELEKNPQPVFDSQINIDSVQQEIQNNQQKIEKTEESQEITNIQKQQNKQKQITNIQANTTIIQNDQQNRQETQQSIVSTQNFEKSAQLQQSTQVINYPQSIQNQTQSNHSQIAKIIYNSTFTREFISKILLSIYDGYTYCKKTYPINILITISATIWIIVKVIRIVIWIIYSCLGLHKKTKQNPIPTKIFKQIKEQVNLINNQMKQLTGLIKNDKEMDLQKNKGQINQKKQENPILRLIQNQNQSLEQKKREMNDYRIFSRQMEENIRQGCEKMIKNLKEQNKIENKNIN